VSHGWRGRSVLDHVRVAPREQRGLLAALDQLRDDIATAK
jgi:hypothetical protein